MPNYKWILFDCMETVIDIIKKSDAKLYSYWAYAGCGYESLWGNFDVFVGSYKNATEELERCYKEFEEYNLLARFRHMASQLTDDSKVIEEITEALAKNYWRNYKANCFVYDTVKSTLSELSTRYKLGVVSNFKVEDGIEELLEINGIAKYFAFVVTSIKVGWRKPHHRIYDAALDLAKIAKEAILFVGDDYVCDYEGPLSYGFEAVLLDKECIYSNVEKRIRTLEELSSYLG